MKFSAVILTWNRFDVLKKCIRNIRENTHTPQSEYEVIVVNNGSTDETRGYLDAIEKNKKFKNLIVIHNDTNEGVIARNKAFKIAKGEYIAQIDDDVLVNLKWDERTLKYFYSLEIGGVGTEGAIWKGWVNEYIKPLEPGTFVDFLTGQFWMFKNEGWLYDESFGAFWHEESDLQMKMKFEKKYRFIQCDKTVIHHLELRDSKTMDWDLHNKNWNKFVEKWQKHENELNLEGKW